MCQDGRVWCGAEGRRPALAQLYHHAVGLQGLRARSVEYTGRHTNRPMGGRARKQVSQRGTAFTSLDGCVETATSQAKKLHAPPSQYRRCTQLPAHTMVIGTFAVSPIVTASAMPHHSASHRPTPPE